VFEDPTRMSREGLLGPRLAGDGHALTFQTNLPDSTASVTHLTINPS